MVMMPLPAVVRWLFTLLLLVPVWGAEPPPRVTASLQAVAAGVQVRLSIQDGWHLYWQQPGDSGLAPRLTWTLPPGWSAGAPRFPVPTRHVEADLVTYIHEGDLVLEVPLTPGPPSIGGVVAVRVDYLVCRESCLPGNVTAELPLTTTGTLPAPGTPWPHAAPVDPAQAGITVTARGVGNDLLLTVQGEGLPTPPSHPVIPAVEGQFALLPPQVIQASSTTWELRLTRSAGVAEPTRFTGLITGLGNTTVAVDVALGAMPATAAETGGWLAAAAAGLLGGLILNLMPCVLPVLALKVLAFGKAREAGQGVVGPALTYTAGILTTWLALGLVLLALRAAGLSVNWGYQLQEPLVVLALVVLFLALSLNLAGVFEIGLAATRVGGGRSGPFFNGVLTTIVATPCGAPFASVALAYAVGAPAAEALAVFAALGLGLAAPVLVLALIPGAGRIIPRPGPWMEDLKRLLAIPLLAATGWMVWTYLALAGGPTSFVVLVGLLPLVILAAGAWGRFQIQGGRAALALTLAAVLGVLGLAAWTATQAAPSAASGHQEGPWEPWSQAREDALRTSGTPFFIDATAAWCLTCQVNKRTTLHQEAVAAAFTRRGVVRLRADYTARDPAIAALLTRHGRASVPTYVLVDGKGRSSLLPDLLTPTIVLDALTPIPEKSP
jgi:thiol:disulfide interchange protein